MIDTIIKRDGRKVEFDKDKITEAIQKAFTASGSAKTVETAEELAGQVVARLSADENIGIPTVEEELYRVPRRALPRAPDEHAPDAHL